MGFEVKRLRPVEWLTGVCAVLLLADMLLDWYTAGPAGFSAWEAFGVLDVYLLVVIALALTLVVTTAIQRAPAVPVAAAVVLGPLAVVATVLVVVRILDVPDLGADSVAVSAGAVIGLVLAAGLTAGSILAVRHEGTRSAAARARTQELLANATHDPPAPPPVS